MPIRFKDKHTVLTGKISSSQRDKIVKLLLSGYSYDEIAKSMTVGRGTITRIVQDLKEKLGKNDVQATIDVAKRLRKKNLSLDDAFSGARIHLIAQNLSLDDDSLFEFMSKVYTECQKNNLDAQSLFRFSEMLLGLQKSSEIPLDEVPSHLDSMLKQRQTLTEEISLIRKQASDARAESEHAIDEAQLTQEHLGSYIRAKGELEKLGLDVGNISNLANMMIRAAESDHDASKIMDYMKQADGFNEKKSHLQHEISELSKLREGKNLEIAKLDNAIQKHEETKLALDKFSSIGVAAEDLEGIYVRILSIAKENKREPHLVLKKFRDDISQYDKKMGFEKSVSDLEEKIQILSEKYKSATDALKAKHAKDRDALEMDIDKLSEKKVRYSSQVKTLSEKHAKLEASAQQMERSVIDALRNVEKTSLDAITNAQNFACESVESVRDQSVKKIGDAGEKTVSEMRNTADSFGAMVSDVSEASEKFGRMDALFPLFEIMTKSEGDPAKISLAMVSLLDGLLGSAVIQNASYSLRNDLARTRDEFKKMARSNAGKR